MEVDKMTKKKSKSELRFAALIRVSTEQQEKQGESLLVQKESITEIVYDDLGGKIVGWYGGQEHATPGWEKKEVDRLLRDAEKRKFNAVIVDRNDRWSRDNEYSGRGLEIFKKNNIRFFSGRSEFDLYNPTDLLFIEMNVTIGKYFARSTKRESRRSRVARAKKGIPTSGSLPHGRTFDKEKEEWGVDPKEKAKIEDAARRYLAGEKLSDLAVKHEMDHTNLHKILTQRCGTVWKQTFKRDDGKPAEVIKTKVPRLLPQATIRAIHKKVEANKTYTHGEIKNQYLLSRMIFCKHCGCAMFGQTSLGKYRYYRHLAAKRSKRKCDRPESCNQINANDIEAMVLSKLFEMFGNAAYMRKAIERATPNRQELQRNRERLEHIGKESKKIARGRDRILRLIFEEKITQAQAEKELQKASDREALLTDERNRLLDAVAHYPDTRQVAALSKKISGRFNKKKHRERRLAVDVKLLARKRLSDFDFGGMSEQDRMRLSRQNRTAVGSQNTP
jgi:DNA invertase Pin-like site-specific DNA recombinase